MVVVGVILLVAGATLIFMGISINDSFSNRGGVWTLFWLVLLITGVIVSIIGATSEDKRRKTLQKPKSRYCLKCGREIPFDSVVCPYCQYDFK